MNATDLWLLIALLVLIVVAAVLGASEAALLRVQRVRLEIDADAGDSRARTMLTLLEDLPRVLNTVLLVVLLVQITAATVSGSLAARHFGSLTITVSSFVLTFILFVYSEAIPKTYAVKHPESVARATAPLLRVLTSILRPVVSALVWFADLQAPGTGIASPAAPTEDELLRLASEAVAVGTIEHSDHALMDRAFELGDLRVDDIYVPRIDVVAVPDSLSVRSALDLALESGHRRIPIHHGSIDNIVGIVRLGDLAKHSLERSDQPVTALAFEPLVVPESKKVVELLADMQSSDVHFAVVVDEYGGTAGIVTIEDMVERLLSSLSSQDGSGSPEIRQVDSTTWIASGTLDTDDLERVLGRQVPHGDWNTVAGLVIGLAGHIPGPGETIEADGLHFAVLEAADRRVLSVRVTLV
jgi:CBS domain containing-hemolysin-like protein